MRSHRTFLIATGFALAMASTAFGAATSSAGRVTKLELRPGKESATLLLTHSGEAKFRLFKSEKRGSVILEGENLFLPAALTKLTDASASGGPVLQMTPYNSSHSGKSMAKLVIQLRGEADVTGSEGPGRFSIKITRKKDSLAQTMKGLKLSAKAEDEVTARQAAAEKSEDIATRLIEVLNAPQEEKRYFGSRVTFEAKDADIPDIFRLVGESSDLNIIWDNDVEGSKTSLAVKDLPWDQLLDIVIQQRNFKAIVMGNVVRIMTINTFNTQAKAKKEEITLSDELEPVVMAVVPLSFAQAETMKKMIDELLQSKTTSGTTATGAAASANVTPSSATEAALTQDFKRGVIEVDTRTNSLVLTNTKDAIERIRRLVRELDVAVPQILIDSKIIIATENFTRALGIRFQGKLLSESGASGAAVAVGSGAESNVGGGSGASDQTSTLAVAGSLGGGTIGIGLGSTSTQNISAALQLSELNSTSRTIASPRVIVNNNKRAEISDGVTISSRSVNSQGVVDNNVKAELKLSLTPQVTSRGSVQLKDLTIEKGVPVSFGSGDIQVDTKKLTTEVLVDSGSTLVLGGVFQVAAEELENGMPFLKDLPFIGWMFRTKRSSNGKSELMVFITPQILDPESSSMSL